MVFFKKIFSIVITSDNYERTINYKFSINALAPKSLLRHRAFKSPLRYLVALSWNYSVPCRTSQFLSFSPAPCVCSCVGERETSLNLE